ncbi:CLUMA_CG012490, isoform A [Clunio marinus]|uniref:Succinate dehydrogenase assembly factor 2, mitochondrial n=1 Tax=Clunio marinus TaxID=568069 RepID=A0A1J1IJG2_9DIPT|nr:CLUMA_CG012490, isoform A [Clunio marinus]
MHRVSNVVSKGLQTQFKSIRGFKAASVLRKDNEIVNTPDQSLPIPKYTHKQDETIELKKARLIYQSRKRGMLENGLLLSTFAARYLQTMNDEQLELYDDLINQPSNDWDIFYWATNVKPTPAEYNNEIMDLLKMHVSNKNCEQRFRQPGLYEKM